MVSSIREKIWEVEKEKKRQRRLAKEGVVDAVEERVEPENNQSEQLFDQDINEDEDFEIPAFLRKQKF